MEQKNRREPVAITIPLDPADAAPEEDLRRRFAEHFKKTKDDLRTTYDRYITKTPMAPGVEFEEVNAPVEGWWCIPPGADSRECILFLHGGAYLIGNAKAYRGFASQIAARAGQSVFALNYPLAPEQRFPAPYDYCFEAFAWLEQQGVRALSLCGDSAGGGLALATAAGLLKRQESDYFPNLKLFRCVAFSPWTDLTVSGGTIYNPDPMIALDAVHKSARQYLRRAAPEDPRASPLFGIPHGMPPVLIQVGQDELLLDDSVRYAKAAAERGVDVRLEIWEGMHHVFQLCTEQLASARKALGVTAEFLKGR